MILFYSPFHFFLANFEDMNIAKSSPARGRSTSTRKKLPSIVTSSRKSHRAPTPGVWDAIENSSPGSLAHTKVNWTDNNLLDRCTIIIWLFSGMKPSEVKAKKDGRSVLIKYSMHSLVLKAEFYRKVMRPAKIYTDHCTKVTCLKQVCRDITIDIDEGDVVKGKMKIPLDFQCEEDFTDKEGFPGVLPFKAIRRDPDGIKVQATFVNLELAAAQKINFNAAHATKCFYEVDLEADGLFTPTSNPSKPNSFFCNTSEKKRKVGNESALSSNVDHVPSSVTTKSKGSLNGGFDDDDDDDDMNGVDE